MRFRLKIAVGVLALASAMTFAEWSFVNMIETIHTAHTNATPKEKP